MIWLIAAGLLIAAALALLVKSSAVGTEDIFEIDGFLYARASIHRVDRRVHPSGERDVVVYTRGGNALVILKGEQRDAFLAWWSPEPPPAAA